MAYMEQQNIQSRYTITETVCFLFYTFVRNLMRKQKLNKQPYYMYWNKFSHFYAFVRKLKEKIQMKNLKRPNWLLGRKPFRNQTMKVDCLNKKSYFDKKKRGSTSTVKAQNKKFLSFQFKNAIMKSGTYYVHI